jgi:hypothetical protein
VIGAGSQQMIALNNCFTEFILPEWFNAPQALKETLHKVWNRQYLDLYDEGGNSDLYDAFKEVIEALGMPDDLIGHKRYVYMAFGIALSARFTVKGWFPEDERPDIALEKVRCWLETGVEIPNNFAETLFPDYYRKGAHIPPGEAYTVLYRFLKTLNKADAYQSLLWLLDDAFTSEALTLKYNERRKFFNWWIVDVTPSAYCLRLPSHLCTAGGIISLDNSPDYRLDL